METIEHCPVCYKVHGQAFNGILQLRNPNDELVSFIDSEIRKAHDKEQYCVKMIEDRHGLDYHFSSAPFTRSLGRKLQDKFGGELIETAKLVTRSRQTSKDLYRVTVLFRYPKFKKDDIIEYKGRNVKVINFSKKVYVVDIKTNKKEHVRYENVRTKT